MKVALFHPAFVALGGAELLCLAHARMMAQMGLQVEVLTFASNPELVAGRLGDIPVRAFESSGVEHRATGRASRPKLRAPSFERLDGPAPEWARARFGEYDALIAHNFPCAPILGLASYSGRKIWFCHEPRRSLYPRETNAYLVEQKAAGKKVGLAVGRPLRALFWAELFPGRLHERRQQDRAGVAGIGEIWANSASTQAAVHRVYGPRDVDILYPWARAAHTQREAPRPRSEGLRILALTRLFAFKNLDTVLRGFALFRRTHISARLDIVGDGPDKGRLERLARHLALGDSVRFRGFLDDVAADALAAECHVFTLLPIDEPFGMVFPEAALRGLILVGPDHGGPAETIESEQVGFRVPAFSADCLAETWAQIAEMPEEKIRAIQTEAKLACERRFSYEAVARRLRHLLLGKPLPQETVHIR